MGLTKVVELLVFIPWHYLVLVNKLSLSLGIVSSEPPLFQNNLLFQVVYQQFWYAKMMKVLWNISNVRIIAG